MKQILLFSTFLFTTFAFAQQPISFRDYNQLKSSGILDGTKNHIIITPDQQIRSIVNSGSAKMQSLICNCLLGQTAFSISTVSSNATIDSSKFGPVLILLISLMEMAK